MPFDFQVCALATVLVNFVMKQEAKKSNYFLGWFLFHKWQSSAWFLTAIMLVLSSYFPFKGN
jgi:hypothetical protein